MRLYNIHGYLIRTIECFYNKATSAVYHDNSIGEWFRTTTGVRQGCLLSLTLFNIFFERIMADAPDGHEGTVSIGGRTITNLRFANKIQALEMICFRKLLGISYRDHIYNEEVKAGIGNAIKAI